MKILLIILLILLSPFLIYALSKVQMMGWMHGIRDFLKSIDVEQLKQKQDEQNKK